MSYTYKHVRPGEQVAISAEAYNAMIDAAANARNRNIRLAPTNTERDSLFIAAVNKTGKSLKRFDVIGLDSPFYSTDHAEFFNTILFNGVIPEEKHRGKFAVLQQSAEPNDVVRVCLTGATVTRIQNENNNPLTGCDIEPGRTDSLVPGNGAEVLWQNNGWAIIRIGSGGSGIYVGNLTYGCGDGANQVQVTTSKNQIIDVIVPYPNDVNESPPGHPCRYYHEGNEWVLFDMACVQ